MRRRGRRIAGKRVLDEQEKAIARASVYHGPYWGVVVGGKVHLCPAALVARWRGVAFEARPDGTVRIASIEQLNDAVAALLDVSTWCGCYSAQEFTDALRRKGARLIPKKEKPRKTRKKTE